ncbi:hypothetical protein CYMTET_3555 [Cymbomonas tetramitiformis]|uniref:Uncharacterized protein n=1 Tax=Cymbomonas tetramitiformis TaxID=36881 RepID=A0AAE0H3E1_9CHLO|nr:hypothetical protein CYMTET_3555 [Cymbomonas tetramitiformis]
MPDGNALPPRWLVDSQNGCGDLLGAAWGGARGCVVRVARMTPPWRVTNLHNGELPPHLQQNMVAGMHLSPQQAFIASHAQPPSFSFITSMEPSERPLADAALPRRGQQRAPAASACHPARPQGLEVTSVAVPRSRPACSSTIRILGSLGHAATGCWTSCVPRALCFDSVSTIIVRIDVPNLFSN